MDSLKIRITTVHIVEDIVQCERSMQVLSINLAAEQCGIT